MKGKLILILLLLASVLSRAQTTFISEEFEAFLVAEGTDLSPNSGDVLISRIDAVQELIIDASWNINSLDLEYFADLEKVEVIGNPISSISFPDSPNLLEVYFRDVPLTNINVASNPNLISLTIYNANLTGINTLSNGLLETLIIHDTGIGNIDISANTSLITLSLVNIGLSTITIPPVNSITYIDLSKNTGLTSIDVAAQNDLVVLILSDTSVQVLDLISKIELVDLNLQNNSALRELSISDSKLTNLFLSTNTNLEKIDLNGNTTLANLVLPPVNAALKILNISASGNITALDVANRTELRELRIFDLSTTSLSVTGLPKLEVFEMEEILPLTNLIIKNTLLAEIDLTKNNGNLALVEIEDNAELSNIILQPVNNLSSLTRLSVPRNPKLSSLDITHLTSLELIDVGGNVLLSVLDLPSLQNGSTPSNLEILEAFNDTPIEVFDFRANPSLTRVGITNTLNGALKSIFLNNGNNAAITDLQIIGNYPSLSCIQVDNVVNAETATTNGTWVKDASANYSTNCAVAITLIPDPNFEAYLALQGWDNNPALGQVYTADIENRTSLNMAGLVIGNIIGIEDFTALETLDVSNNNLVNLSLINNTNLVTVNASNNNISGTINFGSSVLVDLDLSSNQISAIGGLGGVPNLKIFNISDNPTLTSLNFNGASNIEEINAKDSPQLSSLQNLSTLGSLKTFSLSQSLLTSIDFSQNSSLEQLDIFDNTNLQTITISQSGNPNLQRASFPSNNLANLDVTGMTSITNIDVSDNPLTVLNIEDQVNLEYLSTYLSGITSVDLTTNTGTLVEVILGSSPNSNLTNLNLDNSNLIYQDFLLATDNNPSLNCIKVNSVFDATEAVNQGYWSVDTSLFKTDCAVQPQTISFVQDLTGFEKNFNPTPQLIINGDITTASTITITDITSSYSDANVSTVISDYTFNNGSDIIIAIPPGTYNSTTPIDITSLIIQDDAVYESNEFIGLELIKPTGDLTLTGSTNIFRYTILEDDYIVEIAGLQNAVEGGANGQFQLTLLDDNGQAVPNETGTDITINFLDEGNAIRGTDYSITGGTIVNGSSTGTMNIIAVNDGIVEGDEEVRIDIQDGTAYTINAPERSSIDIIDNTGGGATFEAEVVVLTDIQNTLNINEGNRDIELQMSIPNAATGNLIVDFNIEVVGVSATAGSDFTSLSANETFTYEYSNDGLTVFTIGILDDVLLEANEELLIRISNPTDARVSLKNADTNGNLEFAITIIDDEVANAVLTAIGGIEGGNARFTVSLENGNGDPIVNTTGSDISFDVQLTNGTATTPDDYVNIPSNTKITIASNAVDGFIDIALVDDTDEEAQENFSATISNPSHANSTISQATAMAAIAISDSQNDNNPNINAGDIHVLSQNQSCPDVASGEIFIIVSKDYTYTITVSSTLLSAPIRGEIIYSETQLMRLDNLNPGAYEVCVTIPEYPNFEQCFTVNVQTLESVVVDEQGVSFSEQLVSYNVQGSTSYKVRVNDNTYTYEFETNHSNTIKIPLEIGNNKVQITGLSDCQGIYTDEIVIGHITAHPNPVIEELHLNGILASGSGTIAIANVAGVTVRTMQVSIANGKIEVDFKGLSKGLYFVFLTTEKENIAFKIVKK
ncbi:MAG: Calx-beta domain-containing protein [Flavobacteriaceae bacterium]